MHNLIARGLAKPNLYGGVEVDFDSAAVIDKQNKINYRIRLLGHNTSGVYYYTSSLEMIAKRAHLIAVHLTHFIKENHEENRLVDAAADWIGGSATPVN